MKWRQENDWLAVSGSQVRYWASLRGEFLSDLMPSFEDARAVCERHIQIMGREEAA